MLFMDNKFLKAVVFVSFALGGMPGAEAQTPQTAMPDADDLKDIKVEIASAEVSQQEKNQETSGSEAHADGQTPQDAERALSDGGIYSVVSACAWVVDIIDFTHVYLQVK